MHDSPNRRAAGVALLAAAVAATAACASRPDVRHDQDASVDLTAYRSFAFYDSPALRYTSLLEQRLRQATRAQLERAHCVYDERDPDLRVNYLLHVLDKQELRSTPGTGYRGWNGARLETVDVREFADPPWARPRQTGWGGASPRVTISYTRRTPRTYAVCAWFFRMSPACGGSAGQSPRHRPGAWDTMSVPRASAHSPALPACASMAEASAKSLPLRRTRSARRAVFDRGNRRQRLHHGTRRQADRTAARLWPGTPAAPACCSPCHANPGLARIEGAVRQQAAEGALFQGGQHLAPQRQQFRCEPFRHRLDRLGGRQAQVERIGGVGGDQGRRERDDFRLP
jgi:hypothetical protein